MVYEITKIRNKRKEMFVRVTDNNIIIKGDALLFFSEDVENIEIPSVSPRRDRSRTDAEVLDLYTAEQIAVAARIDDPRIEARPTKPAKPIVVSDFEAEQIAHEEESAFVEDRHYDKAADRVARRLSKSDRSEPEPHEHPE